MTVVLALCVSEPLPWTSCGTASLKLCRQQTYFSQRAQRWSTKHHPMSNDSYLWGSSYDKGTPNASSFMFSTNTVRWTTLKKGPGWSVPFLRHRQPILQRLQVCAKDKETMMKWILWHQVQGIPQSIQAPSKGTPTAISFLNPTRITLCTIHWSILLHYCLPADEPSAQ